MARSSLRLDCAPASGPREHRYRASFDNLLLEVGRVSEVLGRCELRFQHRLKEDDFAIMVETRRKTFGGRGVTFNSGVKAIIKEMREFRREHEKLRAAKKPSSRTKSGSGRRGKSPAGFRLTGLRKE